MRLTPPKKIVFWISVLLAAVGILGLIFDLPVITDYKFWFVVAGYVLLALGNAVKGF